MNVERRESKIHGIGVFARTPIAAEHWQYIYGEIVPAQLHPLDRFCFEYEDQFFLPYAPFCWLNHSRRPNCDWYWDDDTLIIEAKRLIRSGTELTINYGYDPCK